MEHIFSGAPTFSDKPRSLVLLFLTQKPAGVIGGLVEATRSDKDHVAELHQLHSAATAEKWAVVDRPTSEAQMIRLTK
jgi:hypothetical protein